MPIDKLKHTITEIDGVRCSIVETGASEERVAFLKEILEHNGKEVKILEEKNDTIEKTFTIGVTDILFNPVFAIYERTLKNTDGFKVTPAYWNRQTTIFDPCYWLIKKKKNKQVE